MTRLLTVMGSGETSPTMVRTHKEILASLGGGASAVMLDTPFGFQSNADELTERAREYFRASVGPELGVAGFRRRDGDALAYERAMGRLRQAGYVFAGPGSPSYALRQWHGTDVPLILTEKLQSHGAVTFASAAALTLGAFTVPVYEIYKVGEDPKWLEGLDIVGAVTGIKAAVIPHFNNAEGGTHDTRFCYLGEGRLQAMEAQLPDGVVVVGIDEHTGLQFDLDDETASVVGLGTVTVRRGGVSRVFETGSAVPLADFFADGPAGVASTASKSGEAAREAATENVLSDCVEAFDAALGSGNVDAALQALLQADEMDSSRQAVRAMVVRLGEVARTGVRDDADIVGPFVEALLALRASARDDKRWADADAVRDHLVSLGVEVRDAEGGSTWALHS